MTGLVEISVTLDPQRSDLVDSPSGSLEDLLGLISRLEPDRLDFLQRRSDTSVQVDLRIEFGAQHATKTELVKRAIVRAEGEAGFVARFGHDRADHGAWQVARLICNDVHVGALPIALPLPLGGQRYRMMRDLRLSDAAFGYVLRCRRAYPNNRAARALAAPIALAEEGGPRSRQLAEALRSAMKLVLEPGWIVEEGICLRDDADEDVAAAIESALLAQARKLHHALPNDFALVSWLDLDALEPAWIEGENAGVAEHRRAADYPVIAIGGALGDLPNGGWGVRPPKPPRPPALPAEWTGGRPFAFLSYAHKDAGWVIPLAEALGRYGTTIWFDRGIEPGTVWDECLESRIRDSDLLIACLSPSYEASRYCRREIKFADLLAKPILPLSSAPYRWGNGLEFLFQELQVLADVDPAHAQSLAARIIQMAPSCVAGT